MDDTAISLSGAKYVFFKKKLAYTRRVGESHDLCQRARIPHLSKGEANHAVQGLSFVFFAGVVGRIVPRNLADQVANLLNNERNEPASNSLRH